ncbi:MAG: HEPN domain-containing protein [Oscillospiraceae bacterium]|nr:HEPN domain-containing protein [Oscillospiraceae bacterium]
MIDRDLVREWLSISLEDLETAEFLLTKPHKKPLEFICYHCQQCAEKSVKGFLEMCGEDVPFSHDVGMLCERCAEIEPAFKALIDVCANLTHYASRLRYPNRVEVEEQDAVRAIAWAKEIYALAARLCEEKMCESE